MEYISNAIGALGKALADKDTEIFMLKLERDNLKFRVAELEAASRIAVEIGIIAITPQNAKESALK